MYTSRAAALAMLGVLTLTSCGSSGADNDRATPSDTVSVEADLFSGQPNPAWTTSAEGVPALSRCLADLEQQSLRRPESTAPQGLGFRGFRLTSGDKTSVLATSGFRELVVTSAAAHGPDANGNARLPCGDLYDQLRAEAAVKLTASQVAAIPDRGQ